MPALISSSSIAAQYKRVTQARLRVSVNSRWIALKAPHGSDYVYIESPQVEQGRCPHTNQSSRISRMRCQCL